MWGYPGHDFLWGITVAVFGMVAWLVVIGVVVLILGGIGLFAHAGSRWQRPADLYVWPDDVDEAVDHAERPDVVSTSAQGAPGADWEVLGRRP